MARCSLWEEYAPGKSAQLREASLIVTFEWLFSDEVELVIILTRGYNDSVKSVFLLVEVMIMRARGRADSIQSVFVWATT